MGKIRRILIAFFGLIIVFSLAGCSWGSKTANMNTPPPGGDQSSQTNPATGGTPENGEKSSGQTAPVQWSGVKGTVLTSDYPAEINKYLEENKTKETQQVLTINNKTYLIMTMGQQSTAGYRIELKSLVLKNGVLTASAKYEKPLPNEAVAAVITYPSLVIETDDIYEGHFAIKFDIEK
jgi:hypothetical protein